MEPNKRQYFRVNINGKDKEITRAEMQQIADERRLPMATFDKAVVININGGRVSAWNH